MRRLAALAGAAALVFTGAVAGPTPAAHATAGSCSDGVLVIVDFGALGGGVARGCASSPSDGLDALHDVGFATNGTQHDGEGFVCRINGRPTASQEPCVRTPPTTRYWSYWHAGKGAASWSYSSLGAMSSHPTPGTIDGWAFGAGAAPSVTPGDARGGSSGSGGSAPSKTKSRPTRAHATSHRHAGSGAGNGAAAASSSSQRRASMSASARRSSSTAAKRTASSSGAPPSGPTASASGSRPVIVDASAVSGARKKNDTGSALPVVVGLALVVAFGAGAGWAVLRRRRAAADL